VCSSDLISEWVAFDLFEQIVIALYKSGARVTDLTILSFRKTYRKRHMESDGRDARLLNFLFEGDNENDQL
jgi:hypothetical protein